MVLVGRVFDEILDICHYLTWGIERPGSSKSTKVGSKPVQESSQSTEQHWTKTKSSVDRDSGLAQTDTYIGTVGEKDQRKKAHIAINEKGDVVHVRDMDGVVLYDKKSGAGHLPPDLNWNK